MKKHLFALALAVSSLPLVAHADPKEELENELFSYALDVKTAVWTNAPKDWRTPENCRAKITAAKKKGFKDAEAVGGPICDAFDDAFEYQTLRLAVQTGYDLAEWMTYVKPEEAGSQQGMSKKPQACLDALDKIGDREIVITKGMNQTTVTVADARAVCAQALADAAQFEGAVTEREEAEKAAMKAEFVKAGAKGDKLAWLMDRGPGIDGWYVKGCKEPKNIKALLKASVWFQWFYPPDGGHMIRRIQFKGNKEVKVTEKHYKTEAKAYKGCK